MSLPQLPDRRRGTPRPNIPLAVLRDAAEDASLMIDRVVVQLTQTRGELKATLEAYRDSIMPALPMDDEGVPPPGSRGSMIRSLASRGSTKMHEVPEDDICAEVENERHSRVALARLNESRRMLRDQVERDTVDILARQSRARDAFEMSIFLRDYLPVDFQSTRTVLLQAEPEPRPAPAAHTRRRRDSVVDDSDPLADMDRAFFARLQRKKVEDTQTVPKPILSFVEEERLRQLLEES
jgi:hypothetical protein